MPEDIGNLTALVDLKLANNLLTSPLPDSMRRLGRLKDLDLRGNPGVRDLPPGLLVDTPLQHLQVDDSLLGKDGLLAADIEGRDAYVQRRAARIDKELHAKFHGGDLNFSS